MTTTDSSLAHWSSFWDEGYITTFGDSKPKNYDGVVRAFWEEKFVELPVGARVLDIAAGNGAIATIAALISRKHDKAFFIAATDLAEVHAEIVGDIETKAARKLIEFHSRVPCERQPFADESFDLVTSQFGFEYSDIDQTLREVRRVLVPGGKFIAISHHVDSSLIKSAKAEREVYASALDELDIFGDARRYFEALGELSDDPDMARKALENVRPWSQKFNDKMNLFRQRHAKDGRSQYIVGTISYIAKTARQTTLEQRLAVLEQAETDFRLHWSRLNDMVVASLDRERVEALGISARETGFESVHCLKLFAEDGQLAGWQIHLA